MSEYSIFVFHADQAPSNASYPRLPKKLRKDQILIDLLRIQKRMSSPTEISSDLFRVSLPLVENCLPELGYLYGCEHFSILIRKSLSILGFPNDNEQLLSDALEALYGLIRSGICPRRVIRLHIEEHTYPIGYYPKDVPASDESIEALEKVELDASILEKTPSCAVCMEDFLCFDDDDQDGDDDQMFLVTRMPCGHHFHGNCIVKSLQTRHICPLCRYPMPTAAA